MKAIKYVGKKPSRPDTVANTGLVWFPDTVHIVTDQVASALLQHPDIWAEVDLEQAVSDAGKVTSGKPDVTDSKPKPAKRDEPTPLERVNVRDMSLNELRAFAKSHLNVALPARITEDTARRKVNEEMRLRKLRNPEG